MTLPVSSRRRKFLVGSPMGAVALALLATVGCSSGEGAESSFQGETAEGVSVASDAVASRKVEPSVAAAVARGEERRLLVVFDDAAIERDAGFVKMGRGSDADGDFARRAAIHAAAKHDVFSRVRSRGLSVTRDYDRLPVAAVRVSSQEALEDLAKQPHVLALSEDRQLHTSLASTLPFINQPKAVSEGKTGANTSVVVLDTGTDYTRSAFGSCTAPGVPSTCRVAAMVEIAPNDNTLDDPAIMHGTNVAGIIAGVAPGTKIIGIDVFDGNGAWTSDIVAGINWAIANKNLHNIAAINMSLGGGQYFAPCATDAMAVAIKNAKDAGILSAVASGNESFTDSISGPACAPAAVAVGAVYDANYGTVNWGSCQDSSTGGDKVVCFSNSSNMVTVLAPGVSVNAAGITMSGTSQATPHVAGSIATLRAAFPSDTPDQLVARLTSTGKPVTDARNSITKPRINLGAAAAGCALQLSPGSKVVGPLATTFDVTLTTGANCTWSLASNQPWVTITSPSSGTGTATVSLAVAANASASRTAKLTATGTESTGTVDISQTDDTVAPTGTLSINGGATSTRATTVALAMTGTDISGVTEMCVTNGSSCTTFEPFATSKAWTLDPGDGPKTVTVFLKDGLGNVTAASSAPKASIVLDGTTPTDGTLVATAPVLTSSGAVILTWSGFSDSGTGIASYKLVAAPGAAPSSCNEGTVIFTGPGSSFQHSGLVSGTTYGYRLCAVDGAGNVSTGATATATAIVDRTAPTGSVVINGNAPYTRSPVVTLGMSATDPSGVTRMCVSPTTTCNAWEPYRTSKSVSFGNGQGTRSVFVWFEDSLGNRSSTPVTDAIVVDTVAPTMGSISARTAANAMTISWSAARDSASGVASYKLVGNAGNALPNAQCTNGTVLFNGLGTTATVAGLTPQRTYSFRLCAVDNAGNTSSGSAFRLTTARR